MEDGEHLTALLTERVADHFDGATIEGSRVHTGLAGITIDCQVNDVKPFGPSHAASLFFHVGGTPFGARTSFASISGYESTPEGAVTEGACRWACAVRPLLRAAIGLDRDPRDDELLQTFEVSIAGRRFTAFIDGLDRAIRFSGTDEMRFRLPAARGRQPDECLTRSAVFHRDFPALVGDHISLVGCFVMQLDDQQTTEVKVMGGDWPPVWPALSARGPEPAGAATLLRELAVLVPREPGRFERSSLQHTLDLIGATRTDVSQAAGWRGWRSHGGKLGRTMSSREVRRLERRVGPLPADLRSFLTDVAGPGAGPGYGLVEPTLVNGEVLLADGGCGNRWVLATDGTVWHDAGDATRLQAASSFTAWYADWIEAAVADAGPWQTWDVLACACVGILSQFLERHTADELAMGAKPGAIKVQRDGRLVDPSHACVELWHRTGIPETVFARAR